MLLSLTVHNFILKQLGWFLEHTAQLLGCEQIYKEIKIFYLEKSIVEKSFNYSKKKNIHLFYTKMLDPLVRLLLLVYISIIVWRKLYKWPWMMTINIFSDFLLYYNFVISLLHLTIYLPYLISINIICIFSVSTLFLLTKWIQFLIGKKMAWGRQLLFNVYIFCDLMKSKLAQHYLYLI